MLDGRKTPIEGLDRLTAVASEQGLLKLVGQYPVIDIRGRGLMCAVEFGGRDGGMTAEAGIASAVTKAAGKRNMLLLTAGSCHALLQLHTRGFPVPVCAHARALFRSFATLPDEIFPLLTFYFWYHPSSTLTSNIFNFRFSFCALTLRPGLSL
jgi:hypothetical protein